METITTLYFVRHGGLHNPKDVHFGRLPRFKLSEEGRAHSSRTSEFLLTKPINAIFSSPMLRCRQTAQIIVAPTEIHIRFSRLLLEVYTPFDGHPRSELLSQIYCYTGSDPQYEQPCDVMKRTLRFVSLVRQRYSGQHIVVVTHGEPILFMTFRALGISIDINSILKYGRTHPYVAPASISKFVYRTMDIEEIPSYQFIKPY